MSLSRIGFLARLIVAGWLLTMGGAMAQSRTGIANIRVVLERGQYRITYDLVSIGRIDSIYLSAESLQKGTLPVRTVRGNLGLGQTPGRGKLIVWNVANDADIEGDSVVLTISAAPSVRARNMGGGPANALLSAVIPGLGSIFVQPKHKIGWRPLITAGYAGLLVYGLTQQSESDRQYRLYEAQLRKELAQPYYDAANQANHKALLALRGAAIIWLADVTTTLWQGLRNNDRRRQLTTAVSWHPTDQTPMIGLRYQW